MSGVDSAQARSGGQWQALLTYPGKIAIGATFDLAADQRGRILLCHFVLMIPESKGYVQKPSIRTNE